MTVKERILIGKILIERFSELADEVSSYHEELPVIIIKANLAKFNMVKYYEKWDKPPELLECIEQMDTIIKKLEQKQNRNVTGM